MSAEVPAITRPNTRVVNLKQRGYFAGAVNVGIGQCTTDVLVLNQDIWFTDDKWAEAIERNRAEYAMIGDGVFGHPAWPNGYVQGTFMFMRRDAIAKIGGLDAATWPLWGATADWQARACRAGFKALPVTGHKWFQHERRDGERYGKAIVAALADEPGRRGEFIRTPPLVSVVIPCYNYGRYLPEAIASLMGGKTCLGDVPGQTFTAWEAIIVDDASTDDTQEIGMALADAWKGVRYIRQRVNGGCPVAINAGIEAAHGRIIALCSADDMLAPTMLAECYREIEANPHSLIYTDQLTFNDAGPLKVWTMREYDFEVLLERNHVPAGTVFTKAAWREVGGYPTAFRYGREDWAFAVAMGRKGYCGRRIPQPLYQYRRAGQNRTLRNSGGPWRQAFVRQMHEMFPDLYRGERPVGCCGGGRRGMAPAHQSGAKGMAPTPLRIGETGMVLVEYIGENVGRTVVHGATTNARYEFSGSRRIGYVDKRDLAAILEMNYGKKPQFRRHVVIVPAPAPVPAPVADDAPPVTITPTPEDVVAAAVAASVPATMGLVTGLDSALMPATPKPEKPKRAPRKGRKNA
jgi:GT2 family glycosyltransferase